MNLLAVLHSLDLKILLAINRELSHPALNIVFRAWSDEAIWVIVALIFFFLAAYRKQWQIFRTLLWLAATIGVTDALTAQVFKPWVGRLRPCKLEGLVEIVAGCAGNLSFPSNHAANGAAFALFCLLWKGPRFGCMAIGCVSMVGLSRVYLGMHYPSDILGGFALGGGVGALSFVLLQKLSNRQIGSKLTT